MTLCIAVIFNPVRPLEMERETWVWFDAGAAGIFVLAVLPIRIIWHWLKSKRAILIFSFGAGAILWGSFFLIDSISYESRVRDLYGKIITYQDPKRDESRDEYFDRLERETSQNQEFHFARLFTDKRYFNKVSNDSSVRDLVESPFASAEDLNNIGMIRAFLSYKSNRDIKSDEYRAVLDKYSVKNFGKEHVSNAEFIELVASAFREKYGIEKEP